MMKGCGLKSCGSEEGMLMGCGEHGNKLSCSIKSGKFCWLSGRLPDSQERFCSMELVS